jgi:spore coat polysaccharide biosynthesis protein SpsF
MTTAAIIQARMGSTRLPGKVLMDLAGRPMLEHVVRRVASASRVDVVCVATTTQSRDDAVARLAARCGAGVFRGSEDDVLARFVGAGRAVGADLVVRITGDCPLHDPALLEEMLEQRVRLDGPIDYYANTLRRTYPRGLDTEIVPQAVLEEAAATATDPRAREHVTWHVYSHPERFCLAHHVQADGRDDSHHRWTVDTEEDFELARRVLDALPDDRFGWRDVLELFDAHPDWSAINAAVEQKET